MQSQSAIKNSLSKEHEKQQKIFSKSIIINRRNIPMDSSTKDTKFTINNSLKDNRNINHTANKSQKKIEELSRLIASGGMKDKQLTNEQFNGKKRPLYATMTHFPNYREDNTNVNSDLIVNLKT